MYAYIILYHKERPSKMDRMHLCTGHYISTNKDTAAHRYLPFTGIVYPLKWNQLLHIYFNITL